MADYALRANPPYGLLDQKGADWVGDATPVMSCAIARNPPFSHARIDRSASWNGGLSSAR
jgi:hypothetical protein